MDTLILKACLWVVENYSCLREVHTYQVCPVFKKNTEYTISVRVTKGDGLINIRSDAPETEPITGAEQEIVFQMRAVLRILGWGVMGTNVRGYVL